MYKGSSENAQRRRDRFDLSQLASKGLPEVQSDDEKLRNVQRRLTQLDTAIKALIDRRPPGWQERRRALGLEKIALATECCELKRKLKSASPPSVKDRFIDVARERLTKPEFDIWLREAQARARQDAPGP